MFSDCSGTNAQYVLLLNCILLGAVQYTQPDHGKKFENYNVFVILIKSLEFFWNVKYGPLLFSSVCPCKNEKFFFFFEVLMVDLSLSDCQLFETLKIPEQI